MRLERAHNIADLRRAARRRLPLPIFDYIEGGADDERTLRRNCDAFADYELIPDVLVDTTVIDTATTLFDQKIAWPLMLSPTGLTRMFHPEAELAVARAAAKHQLPYSLSTLGTTMLETLAKATASPKVFQIYVFKDRGLTEELVERCKAAGYDGLALTVDTPVAGNRERDRVNGLSIPPKLTARSLFNFALHPRWSLPVLAGAKFEFVNVAHRVDVLAQGPTSLFNYVNGQFDRSVSWRDLEWLADRWNGPLAVKGILTPSDAGQAVGAGATCIMVSNHGGRQLDGTPAPIDQIAPIRDALGDGPDIICDGGVRRGSDIVKAVALGATACSIGRPYLYGLAAGGEQGVDRALTILFQEFERTMILTGVADVAALRYKHVRQRSIAQ